MNKQKFVPVLAEFGFNLKTKAFNSYLSNPEGGFTKFKNVLSQNLTPDRAEVYAMILLNSHLNGSYVKFGENRLPKTMGRAWDILSAVRTKSEIEHLTLGLVDTVKPVTVRRWSKALNAVKIKANMRDLSLAQIEALLGYKINLID